MIFKCKICGGSLDVKQGEKITVCEYCGVRQSIPTFIEPKIEEIYNRANNYLMHNEFDKAENLFNQILFDDNSNADAYWNVLMCRYGVSYVKDPASGKYVPTCNRTLYTPIFNDENYKKALQYADETQKELYTSDAKTIDEIQKGILAVSRKEKPFDIFISYKETDIKGVRTQDSIVAQDLYNKLTAEGYKVFFSRITLEDKIGTEYEPYIYAALASSKVMITICSSRENIESVWVKNEWSRYLSFAGKDSEKTLIPLYYDMDKDELPDDFAHLPAYDMKVEGFEQELIRGIKKLIPLPVMLLEQRKRRNKILKKVGVGAVACAVVGIIISIPWFMKIPKYNDAMQLYYDKNYAEATWAFDDLGSYRESKKMKEKCELSWRKSLATVATDYSNYYISPNGSVETTISGTLNNEIPINEHGKIISLVEGAEHDIAEQWLPLFYSYLTALYEDGHSINVYTSQVNNRFAVISHNESHISDYGKEWHNIVQILPCGSMTIGLRFDGRVLYQNNWDEINVDDSWLIDISSWENIVRVKVFDLYDTVIIVGIEANGSIHIVNKQSEDYTFGKINSQMIDVIKALKDISDIEIMGLNSFAIVTKNRKVFTYRYGEHLEINDRDINRLWITDNGTITLLKNNGDYICNGQTIIKDVVNVNSLNRHEYILITRTGSVYRRTQYDEIVNELDKQNIKTVTYDEWVEGMK